MMPWILFWGESEGDFFFSSLVSFTWQKSIVDCSSLAQSTMGLTLDWTSLFFSLCELMEDQIEKGLSR